MSLMRYGDVTAPIRVGDLLGVQQPSDSGRWRAAVIRWVKTPEASSAEIGIELMAEGAFAVTLRLVDPTRPETDFVPAILLRAIVATQQPPTLLLPRGLYQVGDLLELMGDESEPNRIRIIRLLERTGSFEHVICEESSESRRRR